MIRSRSLREHGALVVLTLLADIEGFHGAEVAHDSSPDLTLLRFTVWVSLGALLAGPVLAHKISVNRANREGRGDGDVGDLECGQRTTHHLLAGRTRAHTLAHVQVQNRAARVLTLQNFLIFQRLEGIVGIANWKLRGVRVVGLLIGAGLEDARVVETVGLREAVGCTLGRGRLEVVHVAGCLLEFNHALTDVIENRTAHLKTEFIGDVVLVSREVSNHLVHAIDANG